MLSVLDDPVSDAAARLTPLGEGAVPSMVIGNAVDDVDVLPAGSVSVDEMFHVPSVSVGSVQFVADPMTYVHDTVLVPLVAEMVIVSPLVPPLALIVGVVSLVLLSVFDAPVSDASARSTPEGAVGGVRSTSRLVPATSAGGPETPSAEVAPPARNVGMTVPSEQPDTDKEMADAAVPL